MSWHDSLKTTRKDTTDPDVIFSRDGLKEYTKKIKINIRDNYTFDRIESGGGTQAKIRINNAIGDSNKDIPVGDEISLSTGSKLGQIKLTKNGNDSDITVKGFDPDTETLTLKKLIAEEIQAENDFSFQNSIMIKDNTEAERYKIVPAAYDDPSSLGMGLDVDVAVKGEDGKAFSKNTLSTTGPTGTTGTVTATIGTMTDWTGLGSATTENWDYSSSFGENLSSNFTTVSVGDMIKENTTYALAYKKEDGNKYYYYKKIEGSTIINEHSGSVKPAKEYIKFPSTNVQSLATYENRDGYLFLKDVRAVEAGEKDPFVQVYYSSSYEKVKVDTKYYVTQTQGNFFILHREKVDGVWKPLYAINKGDKINAGIMIDITDFTEGLLGADHKPLKWQNMMKGSIITFGGIAAAKSIKGYKVHAAVFNDYAEYRHTNNIEPGRCVIENGTGELVLSTGRLQLGGNIISDTYGFSIGQSGYANTPIAVCGRVLAYPWEDPQTYKPGQAVCSGPNGTVSRMTRDEIRFWPDAIVGYVSEIPDYEEWGSDNIKVNGRIWIKVH